jgi:hypothetical protein
VVRRARQVLARRAEQARGGAPHAQSRQTGVIDERVDGGPVDAERSDVGARLDDRMELARADEIHDVAGGDVGWSRDAVT